MSRTVHNILETRKIQLCRLLDETSYGKTPSKHSKRISHATYCIRNVENRATKFNKKNKRIGTKKKHLRGSGDMSSKQVRTEVPVDGQTVSKYSFVSRTVDLALRGASHFYIINIIRQIGNSKSI